jgi:tRNA A37 N6-isopentenylltransferase MiaA
MAKNAERRKIRETLSEDFESILRSMIAAVDSETSEKMRKDEATRQYLAPELYRTIDRMLFRLSTRKSPWPRGFRANMKKAPGKNPGASRLFLRANRVRQ